MNGLKWLKLIGLGLLIWGLSLVWPEVNLLLTPLMIVSWALGLGVAALAHMVGTLWNNIAGEIVSHARSISPTMTSPATPEGSIDYENFLDRSEKGDLTYEFTDSYCSQ